MVSKSIDSMNKNKMTVVPKDDPLQSSIKEKTREMLHSVFSLKVKTSLA